MDDIAQLNAKLDVQIDLAVLDRLQEVAHDLHLLSDNQSATPGRPSYDLPPNIIETFLLWGHTTAKIAHLFGMCERTVRRRMTQYGIRFEDLLTPLEDNDLDATVRNILQRHPNCGYKMMIGHLNA
ncbi:hypothetical protein LDENG_00078570 [Lucifuga dentata]|nr:hypothetical protein LDENG_00078570 [Lucifuga dentata]